MSRVSQTAVGCNVCVSMIASVFASIALHGPCFFRVEGSVQESKKLCYVEDYTKAWRREVSSACYSDDSRNDSGELTAHIILLLIQFK